MRLSDERLGEVLGRREHVRALPESNPVLWIALRELADARRPYEDEVMEAGAMLLDLLEANEPGAPRVGLATAARVLGEAERGGERFVHRALTSATARDALLRMSVDALISYSQVDRRVRGETERDAVASCLAVLSKMVSDQVEAGELERALAV